MHNFFSMVYIKVDKDLGHNSLKGIFLWLTVCPKNHHQRPSIACYALFIRNNKNMFSVNIEPSKLPLYMNIGMNGNYKYLRHYLS